MLGELGAAHELAVVTQAEQASAAHRRRHPLARVPVLDDGEGLVFESAAICLQLADLRPDAGLLPPTGSHERALAYQWAFFAMTELEAPLADVSYGTTSGDGRGGDVRYPPPSPEQVAAATARFRAAARALEHALGDSDYLVAGRFGVADVLIGSVLAWADDVGLVGHEHPELMRYLNRLRARPAYAY
jgi:glutathione S-transferase